jgi:hypothetical protein
MVSVAVGVQVGHEDPRPQGKDEQGRPGEDPHQRRHSRDEGHPVEDGEGVGSEEHLPRHDGGDHADEELRLDELHVLHQPILMRFQVGKEPEQLCGDRDDPADGEIQGWSRRKPVGVPALDPPAHGAIAHLEAGRSGR